MINFGVLVFPGSNCDHDCYYSIKKVFGQNCDFVWHEETDLDGLDCLIIPGGFSYGDYLRSGAIACLSPVMESVKDFASLGKPVLGICNGFQILIESGMLPGSLIKNSSLKFVCKWVHLIVENSNTPFTYLCKKGDILRIPIAHGEGNYYTDHKTLENLHNNSNLVFRYTDKIGDCNSKANPNGSIDNIAGICNNTGNVLGMMPHPERCTEDIMGGFEGKIIFQSVIEWIHQQKISINTA